MCMKTIRKTLYVALIISVTTVLFIGTLNSPKIGSGHKCPDLRRGFVFTSLVSLHYSIQKNL
jgi:hypothetical protein